MEVKTVRRAVGYVRVSHEEQVKYGDSLEAQEASLVRYAQNKGYKIIKIYRDEGVSAYKQWRKRPKLMEMLEELDETKPDVILFCRLDRFTRNVEWYYEINKILKDRGITWECSEEDYETTTAAGRTKMGFALLINQDEAERVSERLKIVFENKVSKGELLSGGVAWGYLKVNKHLVKNKDYEEKVKDMFDDFLTHQSITHTKNFMKEKYDEDWSRDVWRTRLTNKIYTGVYRTNDHFCEPFISMETYNKAQEIFKGNALKQTPTGKIFLFTGLMTCPRCGKRLTSSSTRLRGKDYYQYRCPSKVRKLCDCPHSINEVIVEKWLLENVQKQFEETVAELQEKQKKQRRPAKPSKDTLYSRLDKMNHMYMTGKLSQEDYDYMTDEILQEIKDYDNIEKPITKGKITKKRKEIETLLRGYERYSRENKRARWRGIIKEIIMNDEVRPQTILFNL